MGVFVTFTCAAEMSRSTNGCGGTDVMDVFEQESYWAKIWRQPGQGAEVCFCAGVQILPGAGRMPAACARPFFQLCHCHLAAALLPSRPSAKAERGHVGFIQLTQEQELPESFATMVRLLGWAAPGDMV